MKKMFKKIKLLNQIKLSNKGKLMLIRGKLFLIHSK